MTTEQMEILKGILNADLELPTSESGYLEHLLNDAEATMTLKGIVCDFEKADHRQLCVMLAATAYRFRANPDAKIPRSVQCKLNDVLFHQKMGGGSDAV